MVLQEVKDAKSRQEFLQLPVRLYKSDPNWIRPLDQDVEAVFDPKKNKYFRNGECIRWLLRNESGEVIGRVAAFINQKTAKKEKQPTGGMGFFECINDQQAANMLFDACRDWLQEGGMEAMDGPINFGDRDRWWGLQISGQEHEPNYCMPHHHSYYQTLFENYGFQLYFKQFTYGRKVHMDVTPKMRERAERILKDPSFSFRHLEKNKLEKYTEDFRQVYNKAWAKHGGVPEMPLSQARSIMKKLKPIMDPKVMWFGYHNDEPIAFFISLPELNQIFKHFNGQLHWLNKLRFLYYKLTKKCDKMLGIVFGVAPAFQGKGVESAIALACTRYVWSGNSPYKILEMNWIGDFNPKMIRVVEQVGAEVYKTHHTYRYLFDRTKEFERATIIE